MALETAVADLSVEVEEPLAFELEMDVMDLYADELAAALETEVTDLCAEELLLDDELAEVVTALFLLL